MVHNAGVVTSDVSIPMADGAAEGVLLTPEGGRRWPGVLFLSDIGGIRATVTERARRLAALGYTVLVPNVFYRNGSPPFFTFPIDFSDEETRARFAAMGNALTPEAVARDAESYVRFFHHRPDVQSGPIAIVGHCFTGAVALRMAAAEGAAVRFVASFHGGGLFTDKQNSPHFTLPQVSARLYFAHAVDDRTMSADAIRQFEHALQDWGGEYESETYRGAHHGWTMPDHPSSNPPQAERAFTKLASLLAEIYPKAS